MEDFRSRILNVVPSVHYKRLMLLMRHLDPKMPIVIPDRFSDSALPPDLACLCVSADDKQSEIFVLPSDNELLDKFWFRLTDVLSYLKLCNDSGMRKCLVPMSLENLLLVDLDKFFSFSLEANRDGTIDL